MPSADALILRTADFSETSRIVTLYTRQFGKIEALAKGGRRLKSPFESSLDILARNSVTFIQKRGGVLDLLTESKLIRRFRSTPFNLSGTFGGFYVAELINAFTEIGDPQPAVYELAVKVLDILEEGNLVMRALIRFEGRFLQLAGHQPSLRNCTECGKAVERRHSHRITFAILGGGILCSACSPGHPQTIAITSEALEKWEVLINPLDRSEEWKRLMLHRETLGEIRNVLNQYVCGLLGWRPKLHDWWKVIVKNTRKQ